MIVILSKGSYAGYHFGDCRIQVTEIGIIMTDCD